MIKGLRVTVAESHWDFTSHAMAFDKVKELAGAHVICSVAFTEWSGQSVEDRLRQRCIEAENAAAALESERDALRSTLNALKRKQRKPPTKKTAKK